MKKSFYALFMFLAIITCQQSKAQEGTVIYTADFANGFNEWKAEGDFANQGIWEAPNDENLLNCYGYMLQEKTCKSYLISPKIKLTDGVNTVAMNHKGWYFTDMSKEAQLLIRLGDAGEWKKIEGMKYPKPGSFDMVFTGDMPIPAEFNGKEVQFAFFYTVIDKDQTIGFWLIKDITVKNFGGKVKAEAGISYDVANVTCHFGDKDFTAPVLNNPNNVKVNFSSENTKVATVDAEGNVTIVGIGQTLISALSEENDDFKVGEANYRLTVLDPNVIYSASFDSDMCGFVEESASGKSVWKHMGWDACMMADGYEIITEMSDFMLVSPKFTLDTTGNKVSFDQMASYFSDIKNQAQLLIRENDGKWVNLTGIVYPTDNGVDFHNSGMIDIPTEFNGKEVQVAFKYSSDGGDNSGVWYVKNLVVTKVGAEKADPMIAFDKEKVEYTLGSEEAFAAPVLANPNNVVVNYASDNAEVAVVDETTGIVTINGGGTANISATSVETDVFRSATVSYTITVIIPTAIEGISADDIINGKVYDIQGRRVFSLSKGLFIVNGRIVIIK